MIGTSSQSSVDSQSAAVESDSKASEPQLDAVGKGGKSEEYAEVGSWEMHRFEACLITFTLFLQ